MTCGTRRERNLRPCGFYLVVGVVICVFFTIWFLERRKISQSSFLSCLGWAGMISPRGFLLSSRP